MKIEKLNENKIRVIFNNIDLKEHNINVHSFMSNSIESQSFFLNILDLAEQEVGFITDNYKLCIDAIALNNGNFVITVTRIEKEILKSTRVRSRRKDNFTDNKVIIYKFSTLENFYEFNNFLSISFPNFTPNLFMHLELYKYQNLFFAIIKDYEKDNLGKLIFCMSEFASPLQNSEFVIDKIIEYGLPISLDTIHTT